MFLDYLEKGFLFLNSISMKVKYKYNYAVSET